MASTVPDFCYRCNKTQPTRAVSESWGTKWVCTVCGYQTDADYSDDYGDGLDDSCPWCGGDGTAEYSECPEAWGEDCPSEVNHLITCPKCKGSGRAKDCDVL